MSILRIYFTTYKSTYTYYDFFCENTNATIFFCLPDPGDCIEIGFKGITLEICAGLIDKKDKSALEIAIEEVEEECGYKVQPDQMEFVHKFFDLGCTRSLFYTGKIILTLNF